MSSSRLSVPASCLFGAALCGCTGEDIAVASASPTTTSTTWTDSDEGSSEEEEETGLLPKLDIFVDTSQDWLLHFPPENVASDLWQMVQIKLDDGIVSHQCFVANTQAAPWPTSSTFTRDDRLMVSNGYSLWEVSLPDCVGTKIADYPKAQLGINGIAPDEENGLYGVSAASNSLLSINPDTGSLTPVGELSILLSGSHGATWVEEEQQLYLIEGVADTLFRLDPTTAAIEEVTMVDYDFQIVGFEYHPHNDRMYGCSSEALIIEIGPEGTTDPLAALNFPCNNLAAPWGDPELPNTD